MITVQLDSKPQYKGLPGGGITVTQGGQIQLVTRNASEALKHAAGLAVEHQETVQVIPNAGNGWGYELTTPDGKINDYTPEEIAAAVALSDVPEAVFDDGTEVTRPAQSAPVAVHVSGLQYATLLPPDEAVQLSPGVPDSNDELPSMPESPIQENAGVELDHKNTATTDMVREVEPVQDAPASDGATDTSSRRSQR